MKLSQIPIKTQKFKLNGLYEGVEFEGNISIPLGVAEEMQSGETDGVVKGLCQIIKAWNITDDDDQLLPIDEQTMRLIPSDLIKAMTSVVMDEMGKVPNASNST